MAIDETMLNGHGEEEMDALSGKEKKSKKKKVRGTTRKASGESGYRRAGEGRGVTGMKQKNGAVVTGVLFFASLIVLIYTMLEFRSQLLTVIGASACFLIMAAIVISQLSIAIKAYQKKQNLLIENRLTELQNRLLESGEESQEAANMSAVYVKRISDRLAEFEEELLNYQRKENVLMQRIISTQTKAAKVLVKYNDRNTKSLVSSASHQYEQLEKSLDSSIQHTVEELRKIGETVTMIQQAPQPETLTPELLQAQMAAMVE
ncbi:MAG: hypothetical protein K2G89_09210, partial [Lachnospiraceae bacterium]|nr:hypothetical protein [Lachnospiraceae bacterium]